MGDFKGQLVWEQLVRVSQIPLSISCDQKQFFSLQAVVQFVPALLEGRVMIFTDEETKTQSGKVTCPSSHTYILCGRDGIFNSGSQVLEFILQSLHCIIE